MNAKKEPDWTIEASNLSFIVFIVVILAIGFGVGYWTAL